MIHDRSVLGQLLRFGLIGAVGFVVDSGVLYGGLWIGIDHYSARAISFVCAVTATWLLNRRITFAAGRPTWREWWSYLIAMLAGGIISLIVYATIVSVCHPSVWLPAAAVAAGSIMGLAGNFVASRFWVFRSTVNSSQRYPEH